MSGLSFEPLAADWLQNAMAYKDKDFLKRLLSTFKAEAEEHLRAISSGLLELEKSPGSERQAEIIETIFRQAHSLKGAARAVNMNDVERVCQSVESVFASLKRKELDLSPALFDLLHNAVDSLGRLLLSVGTESVDAERSDIVELVRNLESASEGVLPHKGEKLDSGESAIQTRPESYRPSSEDKRPLAEFIRMPAAKLSSILAQAEELISAKLSTAERAAELREIGASLSEWRKEWAKIRPHLRATRQWLESDMRRGGEDGERITKLLDFLELSEGRIRSLESRVWQAARSSHQDHRSLSRTVDDLLDGMKRAMMLPFSSLLEIFPKLVRDLARDRGKDVDLVVRGGQIEIDRRILEEMKDPMIHLVRNCIDHGIERPRERTRKGKPPRGTISIAISPKDSSHVQILVSDDGAGIDLAKVLEAALRLGILSEADVKAMSRQQILSLIFESGISTSPTITDISGRGLGLAIVREKVERLGGAVSLETRQDVGTTVSISLPLTLATFRGVLARVGEHIFVIPSANVERAVKVRKDDIKTVENRETIQLNGQAVSLVRLSDALELPRRSAAEDAANAHALVLAFAQKRIAFLVDEVVDEQEVLVKSLGSQLSRVRNVAGAAVLGAGKVAPILNVSDLIKSAVRAAGVRPEAAASERKGAEIKSVLLVEDSITARTLLKNILEAAGYYVKTAVDGIDALTQLRTGKFDIVVSDVDMPRMNGFELTAKIRSDKRLADLPVVLVTALESREDRERGADVGANAYIVKSSFDQSDLLGVIRRLV